MIDAYGVVGRLCQLVQNAHASSGHSGGGEHGGAEILLTYGLRAREGEQDAARFNLFECFYVQLSVAL